MVTNRTITTDHGYKLGRLANQDLDDAKAITDLASRNMYYTEAAINKASAAIAAENRIRELTDKGRLSSTWTSSAPATPRPSPG